MDMLVRSAGILFLAVILCGVLKKEAPAVAICVCVGSVCVVVTAALQQVSTVVTAMEEIAESAGISSAVSSAIWKTVAISVVTKLASSICTDGGQAAAAAAIELAGCGAAVAAALPLMETVLEMVGVLL